MTSKLRFILVGCLLAGSLLVVVADDTNAQQLIDTAHRAVELSVLGPYVPVVIGAGSKKERSIRAI